MAACFPGNGARVPCRVPQPNPTCKANWKYRYFLEISTGGIDLLLSAAGFLLATQICGRLRVGGRRENEKGAESRNHTLKTPSLIAQAAALALAG